VQTHPNADRARGEGLLGLGRRPGRAGRRGESDEEGVPLGFDLDAPVASEGLAEHPPMLGRASA
jgi:hypothetical protein